MKTQLSLQDLAKQIETQAATRKDYVAPQGALEAQVVEKAEGATDIVLAGVNGETMPLRNHAHRQLGDALQIPARYYDRMRAEQPDLLARNVNTWLASRREEQRMLRTLDGEVRAVLSPKYRPMDNFELAHAVLPKLMGMQVQIMSCALTETRMYIKVILPELSDDLPEGCVWGTGHNMVAEYSGNRAGKVVAALTIRNSEVGDGALAIEPSVFTTWCTNLAVMKEVSMRKFHVGRSHEVADGSWEVFRDETRAADDKALFLKVGDLVEAAFKRETFDKAIAQIRGAAGDKIESKELPKVIEVAAKQLSLPAGINNSILTYLAQGGDFSRWGLASAITAVANGHDDYEHATALEHAGGELLAMNRGAWAQIAKAA